MKPIEATKSTAVPFINDYDEAQELLYMFYYSSNDLKKEIYETLKLHLEKEME